MHDKYTPLVTKHKKKCKSKFKLPWITKDLIKMIHQKSKLHAKYLRKPTLENKTKYKALIIRLINY